MKKMLQQVYSMPREENGKTNHEVCFKSERGIEDLSQRRSVMRARNTRKCQDLDDTAFQPDYPVWRPRIAIGARHRGACTRSASIQALDEVGYYGEKSSKVAD